MRPARANGRHPATKGAVRRSPNRQRVIARVAVWAIALTSAAIWLPQVFG